ncbi:N2,N2-dimethylguanosine tRNA methyltransferase [Gigaspora margarita]|uniref:tRNA (guanine(26)-N(2))-dimethyltransferase n=1 Tax=Gigaspora margarita TaxID=4874 RepID=A0A8H4EJQ4_GIGMA|nr:N2,N2-dimethylguanosine tRNA methyltransferase [Gigaspora margarita]
MAHLLYSYRHIRQPSKTYTFTILEALAASGLRSIRYAKEIPNIKYIIANDLDLDAVDLINKNVEYNELSKDFVRANQGDACSVLYQHRSFPDRFDVIDLDPYGTAAPFIDGAVQAVEEGGLLCVTCTDLANLTGSNYPEKCYANYGSIPVKGEFCHEMALRILLHTLSTSAAKYRRRIIPLLCCSIDFYIRIFVRVVTSPVEVKNNPCKTSMLYVCTGCHSYYTQPLAKVTGKNTYVPMVGPIVNNSCEHCENKFHVGGPIWTHSIHDKQFVLRMLEHVKESNNETYQTHSRMLGMLSVIMEELDIPLFHNLSALAGTLHCTSPSLKTFCSAILNKGYKVSASHAMAGSVKTDAPMSVIWDIFRSWIQLHPVTMKNIKENSPARKILAIEPSFVADFTIHPNAEPASRKVKLVRYQQNPEKYWGPKARATGKRKINEIEKDEGAEQSPSVKKIS